MLLLLLDRNSGTPVYRQIVDQVRFQAASGVLGACEELPSTRALAARYGVNPMTVSKALGELEREGVLERRPGRSHVVAARAARQVRGERKSELARALEPAVQAALQLEIDPDEAAALFARLLAVSSAGASEQTACPPHEEESP